MQLELSLTNALREANGEADVIVTTPSESNGEKSEDEDSLFMPEQKAAGETDDEDTGRPPKRAKKSHRTIPRNPRDVFKARHEKLPHDKRKTLDRKRADLRKLLERGEEKAANRRKVNCLRERLRDIKFLASFSLMHSTKMTISKVKLMMPLMPPHRLRSPKGGIERSSWRNWNRTPTMTKADASRTGIKWKKSTADALNIKC